MEKVIKQTSGYCPEFDKPLYIKINYRLFKALGVAKTLSKKSGYICDNTNDCGYCIKNNCACPIYHKAPEDIDLL